METIIFANRHGHELKPLNRQCCPALLPIANRAAIEYTLDDLKDAGVQHVRLVIGPMADAIERLIGDGKRWDMKVSYCLSHPQESPQQLLPRLKLDKNTDYLFVRGDILRSPCINAFTSFAQRLGDKRIVSRLDRLSPGLFYGKVSSPMLEASLAWPLKTSKPSSDTVLEILHGQCAHLNTFASLIEANRLVAMGRFSGLTPRGAPRPTGYPANPFYVGAHCRLPNLMFQQSSGVIGENCTLADNVQLSGVNLIGNGCVIGANSELHSSLVFSGTSIGKGLYVKQKIVAGNLLIDPASGAVMETQDPVLLCALPDEKTHATDTLSRIGGRLMSLMLLLALLCTLPLWPLRRLAAKWYGIRLPPGLSKELWQALRGKKTLLTTQRTIATDSCHAAQNTHRYVTPTPQPSVFGPRQLGLTDHAPDEEVILIEQEFYHLSLLKKLKFLATLAKARRQSLAKETIKHQGTESPHLL